MINGFRHKTIIEVRFADMDSFGHVNNANYLTYIEQARIRYFNDVVKVPVEWEKQGIILAKATVDFISPILFNDRIEAYTRCIRIGNKSFDLEYLLIRNSDTQDMVAQATTTLVTFDYEKQKSVTIPEAWKAHLKAFDKI